MDNNEVHDCLKHNDKITACLINLSIILFYIFIIKSLWIATIWLISLTSILLQSTEKSWTYIHAYLFYPFYSKNNEYGFIA